MKAKTRTAFGLLVAASILIGIWWFLRPAGETPATLVTTATATVTKPAAVAVGRSLQAVGDPTPTPAPDSLDDPNRPIIDEARVEKQEVCRGEENALLVRARSLNGTDAFLAVSMVDPQTGKVLRGGSRIPFRLDRPSERDITVAVEGKHTATSITLPPVRVKDCVEARQVIVGLTGSMNAVDRVTLTAEVREGEAPPASSSHKAYTPTVYQWNFGDGATQETTAPSVEHSYEGREHNVAQSSFLVTVNVKGTGGPDVRGSRALSFANVGFAPLVFDNRVVVSTGVRPATAGQPEQIWLYHGYRGVVRFDRATLRETVLEPGSVKERPVSTTEISPQKLLGWSELGPRESRTVRDLTSRQPTAAAAITYVDLFGHTDDGKQARAKFTLVPQTPNPNQEKTNVVTSN